MSHRIKPPSPPKRARGRPRKGEIVIKPPKQPPHRPPWPYDPIIGDEICRRVQEGENTFTICAEKGMPSWHTLGTWKRQNLAFAADYARARETSAEALELAALLEARAATPENAHASRLYVDTLKWAAGKRNPRVYNDKLLVIGDHEAPIVIEERRRARAEMIAKLDALARPEPLTLEHEPPKD